MSVLYVYPSLFISISCFSLSPLSIPLSLYLPLPPLPLSPPLSHPIFPLSFPLLPAMGTISMQLEGVVCQWVWLHKTPPTHSQEVLLRSCLSSLNRCSSTLSPLTAGKPYTFHTHLYGCGFNNEIHSFTTTPHVLASLLSRLVQRWVDYMLGSLVTASPAVQEKAAPLLDNLTCQLLALCKQTCHVMLCVCQKPILMYTEI